MATQSPVILALDYTDLDDVRRLVDQLSPADCRLKVGKTLFTHHGPEAVRLLTAKGFEVFLDLKFHDIPNTVAGAVSAAADLGVWMVNVHASGGSRMMEAAREALLDYSSRPLLTAVTVLTSMEQSDLAGVGIDSEPLLQVERLARLTQQAGLDGVVCSAREVAMLRGVVGDNFALVTPGIRPVSSDQGDQRRIATPVTAMTEGSTYLVIGRPITQSADPRAALEAINKDLGVSTLS